MSLIGYDIGGIPYCSGCALTWNLKRQAFYYALLKETVPLPEPLRKTDLWDQDMRCIECDTLLRDEEHLHLDDLWEQERAHQQEETYL